VPIKSSLRSLPPAAASEAQAHADAAGELVLGLVEVVVHAHQDKEPIGNGDIGLRPGGELGLGGGDVGLSRHTQPTGHADGGAELRGAPNADFPAGAEVGEAEAAVEAPLVAVPACQEDLVRLVLIPQGPDVGQVQLAREPNLLLWGVLDPRA